MRKKWQTGLSLVLAAALTIGSINITAPLVAEAAGEERQTPEYASNSDGKSVEITNKIYYIDAADGNDENDGTSESKAWRTFNNLEKYKFTSGAKILLKAGSTWNCDAANPGLKIVDAQGTESRPVILGKYGDGANPVINGNGDPWLDEIEIKNLKKEDVAVVHVKNSKYVTIQDLEVTNRERDSKDLMGEVKDGIHDQSKRMLTGILVENHDAGEIPGIIIKNNFVHDVNGYMCVNEKEGEKKGSGGIMVLVTGGNTKSSYKDLLITGNKVENVCHEAIYMESCWAARKIVGGAGSQQAGSKEWVGWPNVMVTHNYVNDVAGDGIVLINADGGIAEHNLVTKCAREVWNHTRYPAHAAIWMWDCNNVTMQYNEAGYTESSQDGMAFDSDYGNQNVMFQYNYSHHNKGGFWMACPGPYYSVNSVVRYNVSVNDALVDDSRIIRVGEKGSVGHQVYNNTIYWDHDYKISAVDQMEWGTPHTGGTDIYNNIFYGKTDEFVTDTNIRYENNCVWGGGEYAYPLAQDANAVVAEPGFVDTKSITDGNFNEETREVTVGSVEGFKLKQDSPCINAGTGLKEVPDVNNIPDAWKTANADAVKELVETKITLENKDYEGNTVPFADKVDIGAFEYQGTGTYQPKPVSTDKSFLQALYNQVKEYKADDFTESSFASFTRALNNAEIILNKADALQIAVDSVVSSLEDAAQGLRKQGGSHEGTDEDNIFLQYGKDDGKDNSGFETGSADWGNWPSDVKREIVTEDAYSGEKCLKLSKGSEGTSYSEIGGVPITPDTKYILEAWVKCPDGSDVTSVGILAKHHNSKTTSGSDINLASTSVSADADKEDGWSKLTLEFTTASADKLKENCVSVSLSSTTNVAYMDDVVLYPSEVVIVAGLKKDALKKALELQPKKAESYYTVGSWAAFQNAKLAARLKYNDAMEEAQENIDNAAKTLTDAQL